MFIIDREDWVRFNPNFKTDSKLLERTLVERDSEGVSLPEGSLHHKHLAEHNASIGWGERISTEEVTRNSPSKQSELIDRVLYRCIEQKTMSDSGENGELVADQFYAQGVLNAIQEFVQEFATRGELGALQRIVAGKEPFRGGTVKQMPERFTEKHLIRPMLETLGYEDIVSQPANLVVDQRSVPDFKAGGVANSCLCIVEAKAFGKLDAPGNQTLVEEQITGYLGENALTKYRRDLETKYLMGLATDGLDWLLYGKNLETDEQTMITTTPLQEPFRQAILAQQTEDSTGDSWVTDQRPVVKNKFVSQFTADAASKAVVTELQD